MVKIKNIGGALLQEIETYGINEAHDLGYNTAIREQGEVELVLDEEEARAILKILNDKFGYTDCTEFERQWFEVIQSNLSKLLKVKKGPHV